MRTKKHKSQIAFFLTLGLVLLILSIDAAARDWYVRPAGGTYGAEDGTSYNDAWDELWRRILGDVLGPSQHHRERIGGEEDTVEQNPQPPVPDGDI